MTERTPLEQVRWRLAHSAPVTWDRQVVQAELNALTPLERGRLIGTLWQKHFWSQHDDPQDIMGWLCSGLERAYDKVETSHPLFDGPAADAALTGLLAHLDSPTPKTYQRHDPNLPWTPQEAWMQRLGACTAMICRRLVEAPGPEGIKALRTLLPKVSFGSDIAKLTAARLTGEVEVEKGVTAALLRRVATPIARAEVTALLTAPALRWCTLLAPYDTTLGLSDPTTEEAMPEDLPAYQSFAQEAVQTALAAVRAVQSGQAPYKADKLMSQEDAHAVGRALRIALAENAPWGTQVLEDLWRGTAYAPDPKAKTLPSQTLTYQIAHAVIAEPRPEAVLLMAEIAATVRHASVKKRLTRFAKQAQTALSQRPERILDMAMTGPLPPELSKLLKPALEGLLLRDWTMDATLWQAQMTDKSLWPLTSRLIWQVGDQALMPARDKTGLHWMDAQGAKHPFDPALPLRLWHPIDADEGTRAAWRAASAKNRTQPFAQAFREIYPLPEAELQSDKTKVFAGQLVAQVPLIGLARRSGFTMGYQDEVDLALGGQKFRLHSGVRNYPGAGGEGETGPIHLLGPAKTLADVPPRVLSEALRRFDLIISVGASGMPDSPPLKHPHTFVTLRPGGQSIAMRRALLGFARPQARFDGRWLLLTAGHRIHLGTGRLHQGGTPVELTTKIKGKSTPRADDAVMDKIWTAIAELGLAEA
ncbi:DUF4132 domain-containing protein [Alphaproteobacteria bacterium KMM 3653]|uniref:DUF4132 domain-containing protein n=1 Tax=Harenicola maris TaxID=2841044 RepID=A0AAP2G5R1_9RHOB|nr:DUF4132 domain-containing protein [Harenicola maris]